MNIQTLFASVLLGGMSSAMPICAQSGMAQQTIVKSQQTTKPSRIQWLGRTFPTQMSSVWATISI